MTDTLDTAVRTALRDIIAAAPVADQRPEPLKLIDERGDHRDRRVYLLVAVAGVIALGVGGIFSLKAGHTRTQPTSSTTESSSMVSSTTVPSTTVGSSGRLSGEITDPHTIDLSPWLIGAPVWPGLYQPGYLVFDVGALEGWTKVDETGWHEFDDGSSYVWASNVNDPDGHRFLLVVSDSVLYPRVATDEAVDINGLGGFLGAGELSWALDATHYATVTDLGGTDDNERAIALAKQLTTRVVSTIAIGGLGGAPEVLADPTASFAGVVDGFNWTASATPDSMTFTVDQTLSESYPRPAEIIQVGGNDLCVFIAGYLPDADTAARLVLSDKTTIALPTQRLEDGEHWFAACVPYALDATAIEVGSLNGQPVLHQLNWPLLRPTLGQASTDREERGLSRAVPFFSDADFAQACGSPDFNQMAMVASALRADGNRLELWVAPTSTGGGMVVLLSLRHNGDPIGANSTCDGQIETSYAGAATEIADGETKGIIDISGRTDPTATQVRVTFTSGKVVVTDVQSDGYFIVSLIDSIDAYSDVASVEAVDS